MCWIDHKSTKCLNFKKHLELYSNAVQLHPTNIHLPPAVGKVLCYCYNDSLTECTFSDFLLCVGAALEK